MTPRIVRALHQVLSRSPRMRVSLNAPNRAVRFMSGAHIWQRQMMTQTVILPATQLRAPLTSMQSQSIPVTKVSSIVFLDPELCMNAVGYWIHYLSAHIRIQLVQVLDHVIMTILEVEDVKHSVTYIMRLLH